MIESTWYVLVAVALSWGAGGYFTGRGRRVADVKALENLGKDLPTLILDHQRAVRRAGEYLEKVEEVIKEREQWRELYNDQAAGHDNAQALMLQTISALVQRYSKDTGKPPPRLDPLIEKVREDWTGQHGPAVREERGEDGKHGEESPTETS